MGETCRRCAAVLATGAEWCPLCYLPVAAAQPLAPPLEAPMSYEPHQLVPDPAGSLARATAAVADRAAGQETHAVLPGQARSRQRPAPYAVLATAPAPPLSEGATRPPWEVTTWDRGDPQGGSRVAAPGGPQHEAITTAPLITQLRPLPPDDLPPGWRPPAEAAPPTPTGLAAFRADEAGSPDGIAAVVLAICGILLGAAMFALMDHLDRHQRLTDSHAETLGIWLDVGLYATVAAAEVWFVRRLGIRLRWVSGNPLSAALTGVAVGGITIGLLLAVAQAATGKVTPDPRITQLLSEGSATHVLFAVLLTTAVAPVIEETLFRGLLAESLRRRSRFLAIGVSAVAFGAWHQTPKELVYYFLLGAVLAVTYLRRGLLGSMLAHATFNGVILVIAIVQLSGPAHTYNDSGLQFSAPAGWSRITGTAAGTLAFNGPSGAGLVVSVHPNGSTVAPTAQQLLDNANAVLPGTGADVSSKPVILALPVGPAIAFQITSGAHQIVLVETAEAGANYTLEFADEGSARANSDRLQILESLQFAAP